MVSSDEFPTPQGLNVMGAELVGRIFDPVDVDGVFDDVVAQFVGLSEGGAGLGASPREPHGESAPGSLSAIPHTGPAGALPIQH
jgi:hypothetical protein